MFLKTRRIWKCKATACRKQFSVKIGTVLNESPIGLDKWLTTMWLVANCKNGVSSCEIARDLGVTQKTAWFMLHRVREAMQDKTATKLKGEVEVDKSFIGGEVAKHALPHATAPKLSQELAARIRPSLSVWCERGGNDAENVYAV